MVLEANADRGKNPCKIEEIWKNSITSLPLTGKRYQQVERLVVENKTTSSFSLKLEVFIGKRKATPMGGKGPI